MAPKKNAQQPNEPARQERSWMPAALAAVAILAAALLLWQGGALPFQKTPSPAASNTTAADPLSDPSAKILLQYMGKQSGLPDAYAIQFERSLDGTNTSVRLERNGALQQAVVAAPLYTSRYVWGANQTTGCEKSAGDSEVCAALNATSTLNQEADQLQAMLPQDAAAMRQQVEINKKLIEYGAFRFTAPPKAGRYANRSCQDVAYALDYSQINAQELQNIQQIEPAFGVPNPQVFRNFRLEQCMDDEFGIALHSRLTYDVLTQSGGYRPIVGERTMTAFESAAPNITIPAMLDRLDQVEAIASRDRSMGVRVADCRRLSTVNDSDTCLRQSAVEFQNVQFCPLASNDMAMGDCVIKMATQSGKLKPELCGRAGPKQSECYANIAYLKNDISYCNLVTAPDLKALCLKEVGGVAINTTIGNTTTIVRGASQK